MARQLAIAFEKLHGLGNDFIVASQYGLPEALPKLARAICHRHAGVGADGFLVVSRPRQKGHDARVRFFNADGSEAEMSGNGIRCAAAFFKGQSSGLRGLAFETAAGVKTLKPVKVQNQRWVFRVGMGAPVLDPARIPFKGAGARAPVVGYPLRTPQGVLPVTVTSMGNPHCTVQVRDFDRLDWRSIGRNIEANRLFPRRTNVEFVKVLSRKAIEVRFWERGVGETASSGTGSCGAVVACILNGLTGRKVRVHTSAGALDVAWPDRAEVTLTGPVARIAQGTFLYQG